MTTTTSAPASGAPAAGTPAEGTPAEGTPAAGTPATPSAPLNIGDAPAGTPAVPAAPVTPAAAEASVAYEPTNDPGLDMALGFVGKLGLGPDHPAMAAAIKGDFGMLSATLASLGEKAKGWEQYVALAKDSFTRTNAANQERAAKDQAAIHEVVGGVDNWNAIQKWASENAEAHEKQAVNGALQLGGMAAKAMAMYLSQLHGQATGTVVNPADPAPGRANTHAPSNTALSPRDYTAEVRKLYSVHGEAMQSSPEYARLQSRRAAWRG
jgi:hypothetical protein